MPAGRPSKFKEEYVEQVEKLCLLGATDEQIADFFHVADSTISLWKKTIPEFSEALKRGKLEADATVAQSLYKRANGYTVKDVVKIFSYEGVAFASDPYDEKLPPDTTACIFWLKNRQPDQWREKTVQELEMKDGAAFGVVNMRSSKPEGEA